MIPFLEIYLSSFWAWAGITFGAFVLILSVALFVSLLIEFSRGGQE